MGSFGIYVHIPFCQAKCKYCDFVSKTGVNEQVQNQYLDALLKESKMYERKIQNRKITSVFIGGGTPTCLTGGQLAYLLSFLRKIFNIKDNVEWTVEANPGSVTKEKLLELKKAGVNRLSVGVQAWQDKHLTGLGRIHKNRDVVETIELIRDVGFTNYNIDLMYGLPQQTYPEWIETLLKILDLRPKHISLYQLKIEEGTPFGNELEKGNLVEFDNELAAIMYKKAIKILQDNGFNHYEISNFALPGYECCHNKVYWLNEEYLGLGTAASSHLESLRFTNTTNIGKYMNMVEENQLPVEEKEIISIPWAMAETMFLGLRLINGVNKEIFKRKFSKEISEIYSDKIIKLKKQELLEENHTHIRLTSKGLLLANEVMAEFLPE